jgi:AraC family transcriptional activator of pyochelin receptor
LKLLHDPERHVEGGKLLNLPTSMKRFLSPWANAAYREYDFGSTLIQEFYAKRFSVFSWRIHADRPGKLYPISDRPVIALQFMIQGDLDCILAGFGKKLLKKLNYELFYIPVGVNEARFEAGDYETLHIEMEPELLEDIGDTFPEARELLGRLNGSSENGIPMVTVGMNYVTRAIIKNIRDCEKTGGDLVIHLRRYIVDLLTEYITGIRDLEKDVVRKNVLHKDLLIKIKQEILANPHIHKQSIEKISQRHGINVMALKKNFKSLFEVTLGAFIRFHALTQARYLIVTTGRSIDDISDEVGYRYRNNFDKAFKRQFGCPPSSLRCEPGEVI